MAKAPTKKPAAKKPAAKKPAAKRKPAAKKVVNMSVAANTYKLGSGRISQVMKKTGELTTFHVEDMGLDYARTLSKWYDRFNDQLSEVRKQGFSETFIRKWNYYLKYCEAAFQTRNISVVQAIYTKPNNEKLTSVRNLSSKSSKT